MYRDNYTGPVRREPEKSKRRSFLPSETPLTIICWLFLILGACVVILGFLPYEREVGGSPICWGVGAMLIVISAVKLLMDYLFDY